ncbi:hypothetical protein GH714_034848 [Hevea brasiliensis]|uniref:Uncharacterized protein n=1 Tax=Hevea brasiliensis TaxID=3981 RepID=A0A6A6MK20_HEVBR|nr:hypothetical protein GH714_034848 [Hevea brasiliensis]
MSMEEGNVDEVPEIHVEGYTVNPEKQFSGTHHGRNGNLAKENGLHDDSPLTETAHEQLVQMVIELKFQNEFLKSQFEALKNLQSADDESQQRTKASGKKTGESADMEELHKRIESLSRELHEEKQTRVAAEEALKHLREAHSEADAKAQELSAKLAEGRMLSVYLKFNTEFQRAQQKLDQEIKEREEKYSELDSKFQRLHKRAKQRIQEVQKEKDDLEARFREINETAERASSQQSTLQKS